MELKNTHSYTIKVFILVKNINDSGINLYELTETSENVELCDLFYQINEYKIAYNRVHYKMDLVNISKDAVTLYFSEF